MAHRPEPPGGYRRTRARRDRPRPRIQDRKRWPPRHQTGSSLPAQRAHAAAPSIRAQHHGLHADLCWIRQRKHPERSEERLRAQEPGQIPRRHPYAENRLSHHAARAHRGVALRAGSQAPPAHRAGTPALQPHREQQWNNAPQVYLRPGLRHRRRPPAEAETLPPRTLYRQGRRAHRGIALPGRGLPRRRNLPARRNHLLNRPCSKNLPRLQFLFLREPRPLAGQGDAGRRRQDLHHRTLPSAPERRVRPDPSAERRDLAGG